MVYCKGSPKGEIHNYPSLTKKKIEKSRIHKLTLDVKELEKEQIKLKPHMRTEIIKIRAEINELEARNTVE